MGREGQRIPLEGSYFTFSAAGRGSQLPPQQSSGCPIATCWPGEGNMQLGLNPSWKLRDMRGHCSVAVADGFFALVPAVLAFARSALLLWTLETPLDLPRSAGNLQSFICSIIFCHLASILPCSLRYRLSPSMLLQHLAQGGPELLWAFAFQKYSLPLLLVFVNCNALY